MEWIWAMLETATILMEPGYGCLGVVARSVSDVIAISKELIENRREGKAEEVGLMEEANVGHNSAVD